MSEIVETPLGRFRRFVSQKGESGWLHECPGCNVWRGLNATQMRGGVSAWCDPTGMNCSYHETHDYNAALAQAGAVP